MSCVVWGFVHFGSGLGNALASQSLASQSLANILQKNLSQQQTNNTPQAALSVSSDLMRVSLAIARCGGGGAPTHPPQITREGIVLQLASKPPRWHTSHQNPLYPPSYPIHASCTSKPAGKPRSCCWSHHPRPLLPLIQSALPHPPSPQSHPPLTSCPPSRASLYSMYPPYTLYSVHLLGSFIL